MKRDQLIDEFIEITKNNLNEAQRFLNLPLEKLNEKISADKWSVLECLEHLNRYASFYHPEIKNRIHSVSNNSDNQSTKSTWLGRKFVDSIKLVKKNGVNSISKTMNSPKTMNPNKIRSEIGLEVLNTFIQDQKDLLTILDLCRKQDLEKVKTSISISKVIKLRLGDTLRVLIYHNERHVWQAVNCLK